MKTSLRRIAAALAASLAFSGIWMTWLVTDAASRYRNDPRNVRSQQAGYLPGAGRIITADRVIVAIDDSNGERQYPEGVAYAHIVGYDAASGRSGIEQSRYAALRVRDDGSITDWLLGLGDGGTRQPHDVVLTVHDPLQQVARDALGGKTGAVVVIDVATGAVFAYVSSPAYDPNQVVAGSLDPEESADATLDRAADRVLPPGSTFKVIVAAAALDVGANPDTPFTDSEEYLAPGAGSPIRNASDGFCSDGNTLTLTDALVVSCNTVFAALAVDLGGASVVGAARRAGFGTVIPWETGAARSSLTGADVLEADDGALAQTGIGERDVRVTPLLMALIASSIGNGGVAMQPFVVGAILTPSGDVIAQTEPAPFTRMFSSAVAADLRTMMTEVVTRGTGTAAQVDGLIVSGKTGTAEGSGGPHAWFIGIAGHDNPEIAIAVVVESGGSGGRVAAPIAAEVLKMWRDLSG
ncbi:MAG: penicillin-binding transpeptidase domain-containing protein [Actinomycetota bacterium]